MTKTPIPYIKSVASATLFMVLMFFFTPIKAQTYFHKYLEPLSGYNIFQQTDGTYRLLGMSLVTTTFTSSDIVFIKLDSNGEVIYRKDISSAFYDSNLHIKQVGNTFIVDGSSGNAPPDTSKMRLAAIDIEGNLIWHGRYGKNSNLFISTEDFAYTADGGFVGISWGNPDSLFGGYNVYVYKTDSLGIFQWGKVFGTTYDEGPKHILNTTNNESLILAYYYGDNPPNSVRTFILKIDDIGNILFSKIYFINPLYGNTIGFQRVIHTYNNSYLVLGNSSDSLGYYRPILIEINSLGMVINAKIVDYSTLVGQAFNEIIQTQDSGYAFTTQSATYTTELFKLDKNLNIEWIKINTNIANVSNLQQTKDSGYVFSGQIGTPQSWGIYPPIGIIKTDKYGNSGCFELDTMATSYPITVYDSVFTLQSYNEGFQSASSTTEFFTPMQSYTHCFCSVIGGFTFAVNGDTVQFTNTSIGASSYTWNFGDGNTSTDFSPNHVYDTSGTYQVSLIIQDGICNDTVIQTIIIVGVKEFKNPLHFSVYPNPSFSSNVQFTTTEQGVYELKITDLTGKLIDNVNFTGKQYTYQSKHLSTGLYFYEITNENKVSSRGKLVKR